MSVHTFATMGTMASIRLSHTEPDDTQALEAVAAAQDVFELFNSRFSLYRDDSEIAAIARAELRLTDASAEMREAYERAIFWRTRTNGDFTPHRPDGVLDLNGTIKAEAIDAAARVLRERGFADYSVNCGGDVLVSGAPETGSWITGIVDPETTALLSAVAHTTDWRAIATSSVTERGEHIWSRPETLGDAIFRQITVVAGDIVTADVWATAIMAGGQRALDHAVVSDTLAVLAVTRGGELVGNENFRALVARSES